MLHVAVKLPTIRRAYRQRGVLKPLIDDLTRHRDNMEPDADDYLVAPVPEHTTITRRGLLGVVGASSAALLVTTGGQAVGGPFRRLAVLAPRGGDINFPVNKTARAAGVTPQLVSGDWRLALKGARPVELSREDLLAMPQATYDLPIACVEGWSSTQRWTGVRLRDLAAATEAEGDMIAQVGSLQPRGVLRRAALTPGQVGDKRSLLALKVNGRDLPLDHGYPARIIVPGLPGVHNTKWVAAITFLRA